MQRCCAQIRVVLVATSGLQVSGTPAQMHDAASVHAQITCTVDGNAITASAPLAAQPHDSTSPSHPRVYAALIFDFQQLPISHLRRAGSQCSVQVSATPAHTTAVKKLHVPPSHNFSAPAASTSHVRPFHMRVLPHTRALPMPQSMLERFAAHAPWQAVTLHTYHALLALHCAALALAAALRKRILPTRARIIDDTISVHDPRLGDGVQRSARLGYLLVAARQCFWVLGTPLRAYAQLAAWPAGLLAVGAFIVYLGCGPLALAQPLPGGLPALAWAHGAYIPPVGGALNLFNSPGPELTNVRLSDWHWEPVFPLVMPAMIHYVFAVVPWSIWVASAAGTWRKGKKLSWAQVVVGDLLAVMQVGILLKLNDILGWPIFLSPGYGLLLPLSAVLLGCARRRPRVTRAKLE